MQESIIATRLQVQYIFGILCSWWKHCCQH